jgi:hypothetical protein
LALFTSLPRDFSWRTPDIEAAMAASDRFYFEVPVDEDALKDQKQFILENGILTKKQTLRGLLSASEFQTYSAILRARRSKAGLFRALQAMACLCHGWPCLSAQRRSDESERARMTTSWTMRASMGGPCSISKTSESR